MKKSEHSAVWKKGKIYKLKHSVIQKKRHEFKRRKNQMIQPQGKKLNNMTKKSEDSAVQEKSQKSNGKFRSLNSLDFHSVRPGSLKNKHNVKK